MFNYCKKNKKNPQILAFPVVQMLSPEVNFLAIFQGLQRVISFSWFSFACLKDKAYVLLLGLLPSLFFLCLFEEMQKVSFNGILTSDRKQGRTGKRQEACLLANHSNYLRLCFSSVKLISSELLNRFSSNLAFFLDCISMQDVQNPEERVNSSFGSCSCKTSSLTMKVNKSYQLLKRDLLLEVGVWTLCCQV